MSSTLRAVWLHATVVNRAPLNTVEKMEREVARDRRYRVMSMLQGLDSLSRGVSVSVPMYGRVYVSWCVCTSA